MNVIEIKQIAKSDNDPLGRATKRERVRSIQCAEGNQQCFDNQMSEECGQYSCVWREDCD